MENIADALLAEELSKSEEIAKLVDALYEYAADPMTLVGFPRVVQAWGRKVA